MNSPAALQRSPRLAAAWAEYQSDLERIRFLEIQALRGFWGDPRMQQLASYDLDTFSRDAVGSFEIGVGPQPLPGIDNWIDTDPSSDNNTLLVRECFYDWQAEIATKSSHRKWSSGCGRCSGAIRNATAFRMKCELPWMPASF